MIAIWAIKKTATAGQEDRIALSVALLNDLDRSKKKVIMPCPIITELLALVSDAKERADHLSYCNINFRTPALDANTAAVSAKIWNDNKDRWKDIYSEHSPNFRNRFKFDLMILGVAVANKVECFYTGDKALKNMAAQYLDAVYIFDPIIPKAGMQAPLFNSAGLPAWTNTAQ
ncbi:hypothetical protein [Hymenobacter negativus]|uniref:PIN domain-containing protein n=1 Tax=Hymenobacter negativus TaxID=2795026 RepID=A0ABS0Q2H8_9BACT|nr:hypothetical protein [Hymenobacter negativus]MBH8556722.1 hypothetical protein [Hymenobacter negativus]